MTSSPTRTSAFAVLAEALPTMISAVVGQHPDPDRPLGGITTKVAEPMSYNRLLATGALSPTPDGLLHLVNIARNRRDKIRPRWHFNSRSDDAHAWKRNAGDQARVLEAQKLLIELGPALVDLGLLRP